MKDGIEFWVFMGPFSQKKMCPALPLRRGLN